jgi:hypothetical protein
VRWGGVATRNVGQKEGIVHYCDRTVVIGGESGDCKPAKKQWWKRDMATLLLTVT